MATGNFSDKHFVQFPDPSLADQDGLVCYGGELLTNVLVSAYMQGIFPWPQPGLPVLWFSPPERGILRFEELHVPRRLQRTRRRLDYRLTFNADFRGVIDTCASIPRSGQSGTWIVPEMVEAYHQLHIQGYAHSVEVWSGKKMVGGLYGVYINGIFSGESMFSNADHASKEALLAMIHVLRQNGVTWMDTQMVTPVLKQFGARPIPRALFMDWLKNEKGPQILNLPSEPLTAGEFCV